MSVAADSLESFKLRTVVRYFVVDILAGDIEGVRADRHERSLTVPHPDEVAELVIVHQPVEYRVPQLLVSCDALGILLTRGSAVAPPEPVSGGFVERSPDDRNVLLLEHLQRGTNKVYLVDDEVVLGSSFLHGADDVESCLAVVVRGLVVEGAKSADVVHVVRSVPVPAHGEDASRAPCPVYGSAELVVAAGESAYAHEVVAAYRGNLPGRVVVYQIFLLVLPEVLLPGNVLLPVAGLQEFPQPESVRRRVVGDEFSRIRWSFCEALLKRFKIGSVVCH